MQPVAGDGVGNGRGEAEQGNDGEGEAGGVDDHDDVRAGGDEQAGPGERADQAQQFLRGAQRRVGVGEQPGGDHDGQQGGLGWPENAVGQAVGDHHGVDQPHLPGAGDREESQHGPRGKGIGRQEQGPAPDPVGQQPQGRGQQRRGGEEEEHQPGPGVASGEGLDPDAHRQPQGRVAEQREQLPGQVDPGVSVSEQLAHRGPTSLPSARGTRTAGSRREASPPAVSPGRCCGPGSAPRWP